MFSQAFRNILSYLEDVPGNTSVTIAIDAPGGNDPNWNWDLSAKDLMDVLLAALVETPRLKSLKKALDLAHKDIETLQEQIAGEELSFEPPKWEYKTFRYAQNLNFHQVFTQMGIEGWELVAVTAPHAFFKRAKL